VEPFDRLGDRVFLFLDSSLDTVGEIGQPARDRGPAGVMGVRVMGGSLRRGGAMIHRLMRKRRADGECEGEQ